MYRVLCVEDEIGFREDIADFLRMKSFEVDEAANGREALQKVDTADYDLILSDIKMPEMDGFGLLKALPKEAPPVIFLSALNDQDTLVESSTLGCAEFLPKPVSFKVLLAALQHRIKARMVSQPETQEDASGVSQILANCIQHVLSKPLLQISEAAYYLTSLPEDTPIARSRPILEMVKDASNRHLEEMGLLQAALAIPDTLPDTARPVQVNKTFLRMISHNVPMANAEAVASTTEVATIHAQPDWIIRGFTELLRSHVSSVSADISIQPCLRYNVVDGEVLLTYADGPDLLRDDSGYMSVESAMRSSAICESLASRMLSILYLYAVAQGHQGELQMKCDSEYRLSVRMRMPKMVVH